MTGVPVPSNDTRDEDPSPDKAKSVLVEVDDGVAVVRLNRPDSGNSMTSAMGALYVETLQRLDKDTTVRVVVVTGSGKAFCAGADLAALDDVGKGSGPGAGSRLEAGGLEESYLCPLLSRKPYIAAVNGACVGVGLAVAMGCDVRYVARDATVAASFARLGLVADFGLSWILPRVMGVARATEILLSGRRMTGAEAAASGLATEVLDAPDVLPRALAYARDLATNCSPKSMAVIKRQVYDDLDATLHASYARAVELMKDAFAGPDLSEGVRALTERRAPEFAPLGT